MSFMAVAIGGSAIVGYAASRSATKAASRAASESNETMREAAQLQYDLGKEALDFNKQYYSEVIKPSVERDLKLREDLQAELLPSLKQQREFAADQQKFYTDTFQPLERQMVRDAEGYDSEDNVGRRMGIAAANVNQQFSNATGQQARLLTRYGLNPNSSAFARTNANLVNQQALAAAGAQTGAAFDTMDRGIALRAGAANFGRNMPNTSAQFGQVGNQTAGTAAGVSAGGVGTATAAGNFMSRGYGLTGDLTSAGAGIDNNIFRNNIGMAELQARGVGQLFSGIGQGVGMWGMGGFKLPRAGGSTPPGFGQINPISGEYMGSLEFADGGMPEAAAMAGPAGVWTLAPRPMANGGMPHAGLITGPGSGISDDIPGVNVDTGEPVRLSNKEYVIPEDVVLRKGTEFFDKLLEKHHTPAVAQRMGLQRRA